ncbi:hypothetical protein FKP32DRAFT_1054873 [Trametes sanguinea]|nr:hypothetical protein FKP32DRAFT_1054873 [Trametes sanguinea]
MGRLSASARCHPSNSPRSVGRAVRRNVQEGRLSSHVTARPAYSASSIVLPSWCAVLPRVPRIHNVWPHACTAPCQIRPSPAQDSEPPHRALDARAARPLPSGLGLVTPQPRALPGPAAVAFLAPHASLERPGAFPSARLPAYKHPGPGSMCHVYLGRLSDRTSG